MDPVPEFSQVNAKEYLNQIEAWKQEHANKMI